MDIKGSSIALYTPASRTRLAPTVQKPQQTDEKKALIVATHATQQQTAQQPIQGELLQRMVGSYETTQSYLVNRNVSYSSSTRYMVDRYINQQELVRKQAEEEDSSIDYYV